MRIWQSRVFFSRMLHGRGVCRVAPPFQIAAAVACAGDLISQLAVEGRGEVDCKRCFVCTGLGGMLDGSALQHWFGLMHRALPGAFVRRLTLHELACAPGMCAVSELSALVMLQPHADCQRPVFYLWRAQLSPPRSLPSPQLALACTTRGKRSSSSLHPPCASTGC